MTCIFTQWFSAKFWAFTLRAELYLFNRSVRDWILDLFSQQIDLYIVNNVRTWFIIVLTFYRYSALRILYWTRMGYSTRNFGWFHRRFWCHIFLLCWNTFFKFVLSAFNTKLYLFLIYCLQCIPDVIKTSLIIFRAVLR